MPVFAATPVYKLHVDGLACPFCAYGVEKQVGKLANVQSVDIEIDQGLVTVTMEPDKTLSEADAKQAVSDAGFTLRKFEKSTN
ncbi:MAG TPA: copper chaperone [Gammaproteobacteria bacterium]|nr:copper chaperone [Gammaproteobacteria bacterium]